MDVNALGLLVEIIDAGNLSRAAARLGMSRANVSHRLAQFERDLGQQLLRRTTRQIEPTELGAVCMSMAAAFAMSWPPPMNRWLRWARRCKAGCA